MSSTLKDSAALTKQRKQNNIEKIKNCHNLQFLKDKYYFTEYAAEILQTYFESEKVIFHTPSRSQQINLRNDLIQAMKSFARNYNFSVSTLHLAVLILDCYMDDYELSDVHDYQRFFALLVLLLAAKSEDLDENLCSTLDILKVADISSELEYDYKKETHEPKQLKDFYQRYNTLYCTLEFLVFQKMNFNLDRPTAITFLSIFQEVVVTEDDMNDIASDCGDKEVSMIENFDDLCFLANEQLKYMIELLFNDMEFYIYLPSKIAAAMIYLTRKYLNIKTLWNSHLEILTQTTVDQIQPIVELLLRTQNSSNIIEEIPMPVSMPSNNNKIKILSVVKMKDDSGYFGATPETQGDSFNQQKNQTPCYNCLICEEEMPEEDFSTPPQVYNLN